jgi:hypothetical protein
MMPGCRRELQFHVQANEFVHRGTRINDMCCLKVLCVPQEAD